MFVRSPRDETRGREMYDKEPSSLREDQLKRRASSVPCCQHIYPCSWGCVDVVVMTVLVGVEGVEWLSRADECRTNWWATPGKPPHFPKVAQLHPHMEQAAHQTGVAADFTEHHPTTPVSSSSRAGHPCNSSVTSITSIVSIVNITTRPPLCISLIFILNSLTSHLEPDLRAQGRQTTPYPID